MRHLVIGQRQKVANFSAFHWWPHDNLVSIGQHFVITRVVHLPKRTETSLITELLSGLITESNQGVRAVHSCNSWFDSFSQKYILKILCKRGEIAPQEQFLLFYTIFCNLILDFCVKTRTGFSLRDKRLFEIIEVEITRVDCIYNSTIFASFPFL